MAAPNIQQTDLWLSGLMPGNTGIGVGLWPIPFPVVLAGLAGTNNVVTGYAFGFTGRIITVQYIPIIPVTTAAKAATITPSLGGVNLTAASGNGGALALTSANCAAGQGPVTGTAITGGNSFGPTTLFAMVLSSVTAFAEGSGVIFVTVYNDDLRNAVALAF